MHQALVSAIRCADNEGPAWRDMHWEQQLRCAGHRTTGFRIDSFKGQKSTVFP